MPTTKELILQLHVGVVLFALCLSLLIAALSLIAALLERTWFREEASQIKQQTTVGMPVKDNPEIASGS